MTEIGVTAKPRKKFGPFAWLAVAVAVLVVTQLVIFGVKMANDPRNQPLSISDADAQQKCEAEVTKNTKNPGSVSFPSGTKIERHDKFVNVDGRVTSRQSIETTQPYECQVIKFDDGSVGAVELTVDRVGSK